MPNEPAGTQLDAAANPASWVADHGDALFAYAMGRVRDRDVAEELAQDALLIALRRRDSFEGRSMLRTWLVGILRNRIMEHYRAARRRGAPEPIDHPDGYLDRYFKSNDKWKSNPGSWGDPTEALESREVRMALDECLAALPARASDAIVLRAQQGIGLETVAATLDVTTNHLSVILHRARTAMRACLEVKCFDGPREAC